MNCTGWAGTVQAELFALAAVTVVSLGGQGAAYWVTRAQTRNPRLLLILVALAAGAMAGEALLHAIPEAAEAWEGHDLRGMGVILVAGFGALMLLGAIVRNRACCDPTRGGAQPVAWTSLSGDVACNFADGIAIAASFLVSIPLGIAATIAILLHELPQEAGQCAVLLKAGMHPRKAMIWNAITALPALAGATIVLLLPLAGEGMERFLLPAVAGAFLHIAIADLLPKLRQAGGIAARHGVAFTVGIMLMAGLMFLE